MNKKIFSVIIPFYNSEATIERTMASLISSSDYIYEIILVNDHSNDNTIELINKFEKFFDKITILDNYGKQSPSSARLTGLLYAKSDWVTFVDSDDCLTHSSLRYIYKEILDNKKIVLLHCKSIYYESGKFNVDSIEYSDNSCGGNFYKRDYLIKNNLLPHKELYMCEDEYFNEIIKTHLLLSNNQQNIHYFDYPVYEVHHDISSGLSFALSNWSEYVCKYRLLYKEYVVDYFKNHKNFEDKLIYEYIDNFIFSYFLIQPLINDGDFNIEYNIRFFKRAIYYFYKTFNKPYNFILEYYNNNEDVINSIYDSAMLSSGENFNVNIKFDDFFNMLL